MPITQISAYPLPKTDTSADYIRNRIPKNLTHEESPIHDTHRIVKGLFYKWGVSPKEGDNKAKFLLRKGCELFFK
jgi:hypothetical protein